MALLVFPDDNGASLKHDDDDTHPPVVCRGTTMTLTYGHCCHGRWSTTMTACSTQKHNDNNNAHLQHASHGMVATTTMTSACSTLGCNNDNDACAAGLPCNHHLSISFSCWPRRQACWWVPWLPPLWWSQWWCAYMASSCTSVDIILCYYTSNIDILLGVYLCWVYQLYPLLHS